MKGLTKVVLASFIAFLVFTSLACGGNANWVRPNDRKERLIVIEQGAPASLDPALTNDSASSILMKQVYDTLFNQNFDTMEIVPSLAERYVFENDAAGQPTRLRLFLKQGVKFHNGEEFKASDVKFTLERARTSAHISHIAGAIASVEVVNDYEVLIFLEYPFAPILNNLAHTAMSITNEKAVVEGGDAYARNPIGTGPMRFVEWITGDRIELERWDDYYGTAPRLKNITIRYIQDAATSLLEVQTGGADIVTTASPNDMDRIEADANLQLMRRMNLATAFIGFNMIQKETDNPFENILVRQAIMHAVDTQAILREIYRGSGAPGRGPLTESVFASASNILEQYEFNPERARQLLAEAGYPNGFRTKISTNDNPVRIDVATAVSNMLGQIGIQCEVDIVEWAAYLDMTARGDHEMYILGWVTVTGDPDYGLEIFHSRAHGSAGNRSFYTNPEVDRLLDLGRVETNADRRRDIYIQAQQLIHADAPQLYIQDGEYLVAARSDVRGFVINPAGHHPFWNVYFE